MGIVVGFEAIRGKRLLRKRGELLERPFAHCYETGGMRRTHLREHRNILKRLLIHAAGFNLALVMRKLLGTGKPRAFVGMVGLLRRHFSAILGQETGIFGIPAS